MFEKLVDIICNYVETEPENIHPESRLAGEYPSGVPFYGRPWIHIL